MIVVDEYTTIEFMGSSEYDSYMESRLTLLLEDGFVELGNSDIFSVFVENNRADYRIDAVPEAAGKLTF